MKKKVRKEIPTMTGLLFISFFVLWINVSAFASIPEKDNLMRKVNEINQNQQKEITGKVTDTQGQPLPGVTVTVKGTTRGTVTDADGNYSLSNIANDNTLVFSFVGMETQEIYVGDQTRIDVTMQESAIALEEVIAVGYGSMQRNKVSASISSLDPEKIIDQSTNSIDNALEGKIAGVSIMQGSGAPGGGSVIKIRGSGSIGASNDPLIVVDGIPMQSSFDKERSPLTLIDQSDIASMEVLKDVAATAIYGSRGSNGVILITTKSGKKGTQISLDMRAGVQRVMPQEKLDMMNAEEFARWRLENAQEYANFYGEEFDINDVPEEYRNPEFWRGKGTDWQEEMWRIAPQQSYNLTISHGTENFNGFFSIGYTADEGAVVETDFKRLNLRANIDYKPAKFLTVGLKLNPVIRWWGNPVGGNREQPYGNAVVAPPTDGPYYDDVPNEQKEFFNGKWDTNIWSSGTFNFSNSLYDLKHQVRNDETYDLYISPYVQISPLDGLTLKSQLNMQWNQSFNEYFKPSDVNTGWSTPPQEITGYYNTYKSYNWQFENTLTYEKTIEKHSIIGLIGYTMEHYNSYSSNLSGGKFPSDEIKTLNAAQEYTGGSNESNWSLLSTIFRLSYDYNVKYLFTGAIRRDGSSRFGPEKRWGYFPSISIGWNISKENFFPHPAWLTNLKLRASYGSSGNNRIGDYTWQALLNRYDYTFGGNVVPGEVLAGMENKKLSWEKTSENNIGLDLTLWSGRLNFIFDFYNKNTENMLWNVPIPISSGFSSVMQNIGKIQNKGIEFSINSINIEQKDFRWESDFNISFNRNKVLNLGPLEDIKTYVGYEGQWQITKVGEPMGMFYGWKSLGILNDWEDVEKYVTVPGQLPGTPHWFNANGDDIIDERDRIIIGNPHPKFRGGFNNYLIYKNWDFNISMSFAHDFDVYAGLEATILNLDGVFNVLKEVEERWRSPEQPGNGRIAASFHQTYLDREGNSDFVYNASFLKVQNISIGYTFNKMNAFKRMRLYLSLQNPFLFTNYKYGNPDINLYGNSATMTNYQRYDYPLTQSCELGINLTF